MDYVFGLLLILDYLFGAVWLCDVQSVTRCFQNLDYTAVSDSQKACLEVKEYEDCVSPYADACADNAVFATYQNQMKLVQSSCKASNGGSCDVMGLQKCMAEVESSQGESKGPQDTCKSYPRFVECVEPAIQGCNSSNPQYRNIQPSIDSFRRLCDKPGAVGQGCNLQAAMLCVGSLATPSNTGLDCEAYRTAASCLEPYKESCMSEASMQSILSSLATMEQFCGGASGGGCDMVKAMGCMGSMSQQPSADNVDCTALREKLACLEPYREVCKTDDTVQALFSSLDAVVPFCGDCNVLKCYTDAGIDLSNMGTSALSNCDSIGTVRTCIESQSAACEGNVLYSSAQKSLQQLGMLCSGKLSPEISTSSSSSSSSSSSCNYKEVEDCVTASGGLPSPGGELKCGSEMNVEKCVNQFQDKCSNDSVFSLLENQLKTLKSMCIKLCDYSECNMDFTFPNGIPSEMNYELGCRSMENAVKCMEPKFKSCPNGMERAMEGIKKFCMDSGTELGLTTYQACLETSKLNTDCSKFLSHPMDGKTVTEETEEQECMRIDKYSKCAKDAMSQCQMEGAGMFAAETARKIITLKSQREGGIDCSTGAGTTVFPSLLLLMVTAILTFTKVF